MLIRTTTLWGRHHDHLPLRHGDVKLRNCAVGRGYEPRPAGSSIRALSHCAMLWFSEILVYFSIRNGLFFPPKRHGFPSSWILLGGESTFPAPTLPPHLPCRYQCSPCEVTSFQTLASPTFQQLPALVLAVPPWKFIPLPRDFWEGHFLEILWMDMSLWWGVQSVWITPVAWQPVCVWPEAGDSDTGTLRHRADMYSARPPPSPRPPSSCVTWTLFFHACC